jgi:hypothetical protein
LYGVMRKVLTSVSDLPGADRIACARRKNV